MLQRGCGRGSGPGDLATRPATLIEDLDFLFHHWFAESTDVGYRAADV